MATINKQNKKNTKPMSTTKSKKSLIGNGENSLSSAKSRITKDTNIGELVMKYPEVAEVLLDYGLHCVGCFANTFDTIEMGAKIHGMDDSEVLELVERVNEVINFEE